MDNINDPEIVDAELVPESQQPTDPVDAAAAGYEAFEEGDYELAIRYFSVEIDQTPLPTLYYYRGVAYDMSGHPNEAIADFSRCIDADSNHTWAMYSRGVTYQKLEKWEPAFADVRRAYEIDPGDFRIANVYARMLATSPVQAHRNSELAVKVAMHGCKLTNWEDPICVQTLADAYREAGNVAKAKEYDRKIREMNSCRFDYDYETVCREIHDYFTHYMGKHPNELGLQEIIPGKVNVAVWTIDRENRSKPNLIFTTGMSERPMAVPEDADDGAFAEVCMQLPPGWPTQPEIEDRANLWPWIWLRMIAHYPHEKHTWIGEYPSVFPVEGPLKPLGPDCKFTALLLVPNFGPLKGFPSDEGPFINIITAIPIYTEEYEMAKGKDGIPRLFARFQELGMSPSLMPNRLNAALP